jgi:hypothetical protein
MSTSSTLFCINTDPSFQLLLFTSLFYFSILHSNLFNVPSFLELRLPVISKFDHNCSIGIPIGILFSSVYRYYITPLSYLPVFCFTFQGYSSSFNLDSTLSSKLAIHGAIQEIHRCQLCPRCYKDISQQPQQVDVSHTFYCKNNDKDDADSSGEFGPDFYARYEKLKSPKLYEDEINDVASSWEISVKMDKKLGDNGIRKQTTALSFALGAIIEENKEIFARYTRAHYFKEDKLGKLDLKAASDNFLLKPNQFEFYLMSHIDCIW